MHADLSEHLHSDECNKLINELKQCHTDNTIGRFIGACNSIDTQLSRCLRLERKGRQAENYKKSIERRQEVHERLRKDRTEEA